MRIYAVPPNGRSKVTIASDDDEVVPGGGEQPVGPGSPLRAALHLVFSSMASVATRHDDVGVISAAADGRRAREGLQSLRLIVR